MVNEAGQPADLQGRANGAVIEVVVDHSDGSLAFGVNGAPPRRVPEGWPTGEPRAPHEDNGGLKIPYSLAPNPKYPLFLNFWTESAYSLFLRDIPYFRRKKAVPRVPRE